MWGGSAGGQSQYGQAPMAGVQQTPGQKHDIFVGNLAFNTTEEQLHQVFSDIGRVLNVRMVTDSETGKPRGFAFVEFEDPQVALSAIRNMNDFEMNGRKLRVNFSNSSHLEVLAGKLGMDLSQQTKRPNNTNKAPESAGTTAVADTLKGMSKAEMYDVVAKLKEIADNDADEARRLIASHPQLPEALLFLMSKLDMVKQPLANSPSALVPAAPPTLVRAADPRAAAAAAAAAASKPPVQATSVPPPPPPPRIDPRQQQQQQAAAPVAAPPAPARIDPRQRVDPRQRAPPPPPVTNQPPPPYRPQSQAVSGGGPVDPALIQQVMSLTPQQLQQLPPDKLQSIMQLRQQIMGGTGM